MNTLFTDFTSRKSFNTKDAVKKDPTLEALLREVNSIEHSLREVEEVHELLPLLKEEKEVAKPEPKPEKPPHTHGPDQDDIFEDIKYKSTDKKVVFGQPIDVVIQKRGFLGIPLTKSGAINPAGILKDLSQHSANNSRFITKHLESVFGTEDSEVTGALRPIINTAKKAAKIEKDFRKFFHL